MIKKLGAVLLVLAACKGGDDKGKSGGGGGGKSGKGGCETTAKKPAELVAGTTSPQVIAPLTGVKLGMSPAEVAKICPNFFEGEDGKKAGTFSVGEIVGKFGELYAQGRFNFVADKLVTVELSVPAEIADALSAAWGPATVSNGAKPAHAWLDEASGIRAILEPVGDDGRRELVVSSFTPLAAFIDPETVKIPFKPQDVLNKQPADLAKKFAQYVKVDTTSAAVKAKTDEMMADMKKDMEKLGVNTKRNGGQPEFELPATPYGTGPTNVILYTDDDGSVRSYGIWFRTKSTFPEYGFPEQSTAILKLLDTHWGTPKKIKETLGERSNWFDPNKGLRVATKIDKPEDLDLVFVRYLPLAKFFGAPGALWGFEKAERPLIGATPDEIVASYGTDTVIKRDDAAGTITMSMPPTDYEGDTARTTILMFVRAGKVGEWRTSIPFEDYEPAKAEYEALLNAKLGAPKPAKEHFLYGKGVDVQYSKYTHELDIEVTK